MTGNTYFPRLVAATALGVAIAMLAADPAQAAKPSHSQTPTGIDVSYPQCADSLPTGEAFAIIGVNGGLANDYNTCLGTEFSYAQHSTGTTSQAKAQLYLNTADPGNGVADWPSPGQLGAYATTSTPNGPCSYVSGNAGPGANSPGCAYIYGYDMIAGITYNSGTGFKTIPGDISAFNSATSAQLYSFPTWLDVETSNSWESGTTGLTMNVADLQGMVAGLDAAAKSALTANPPVGIYSTGYQWNAITGTPGSSGGSLSNLPDWIPGARGESGAVANCALSPFTGGPVSITQWFGNPYDGDYSCVG